MPQQKAFKVIDAPITEYEGSIQLKIGNTYSYITDEEFNKAQK